MKTLSDILSKVRVTKIIGDKAIAIKHIQVNSMLIKKGDVFVAMKGTKVDGHDFISQAIQNGASVIVCEQLPEHRSEKIIFVLVENAAIAVGNMLNNYYNKVAERLKIVGVTGTNGKTSTATILFELFKKMKHKVGLLSTVQNFIHHKAISSTHTTPDVVNLYSLFNQMQKAKCEYVFMECSSHAIHQHRIAGIQFSGAVFTNITHDHLDYHQHFKNYIDAKKMLFDALPKSAFAISNIDDKRGLVMLQNTKAKKITYSLQTLANFKGKIITNALTGLELSINNQVATHFQLVGEFNAYNLLAVYATAISLGKKSNEILQLLSTIKSPNGRFELLVSPQNKIHAIVDYAHTPDALENVLKTIRKTKQKNQNVYTVIGCGGDRDKTKRPLMGSIAATFSDVVVLTSDNPRSENPKKIIQEMTNGIASDLQKKAQTILDRTKAIQIALTKAKAGDIVLVAGKGHETYQDIKGVKTHFSDKEKIQEIFQHHKL